jgi:hypothetical protein
MNIAHFETRLTETIAWCSLQKLVNDPPETEEFHNRAQLARQGRAFYRRAELLENKNNLQNWLLAHLRFNPREESKELRREGLELMRAGDVTPILPLNNQLRTPELKPEPFVSRRTDQVAIVEELAVKRAKLLRQRGEYPTSISSNLGGGRLLVYEPDCNVEDGASQNQSKGHFDGQDAPPWDTWIAYKGNHLIAWVPPPLLDLIKAGIEVNCVDCIRWAEENLLEKMARAAI